MKRRVVITGIGLVSPLGNDTEKTWAALLEGTSGAGPITRFDPAGFATQFACEVKGFDASPYFQKRELRRIDPFFEFGVSAGMMALADAGLGTTVPEGQEERWRIYVGSGLGGVQKIEDTHSSAVAKGPRHGISPYFVPDIIINMVGGALSIRTGAKGANFSHVSACATGAHSIGEAYQAIQWGLADGALAGGSDANISVLGVGGFNAMRALSTRNDDPAGASCPFTTERDGFVMGEGACVVVLEELANAQKRGARIYAEVLGYGATSDAHHMTAPSPEGEGAQRCMREALTSGNIAPSSVDYINAHGTSTPYNDKHEAEAIRAVFGNHDVLVSSTKSMTGHMLGAAGAAEIAFCALSVRDQVIPPTINHPQTDPECQVSIVANEAMEKKVEVAMSNSFGFGGTNGCVVVGKVRP